MTKKVHRLKLDGFRDLGN